MPRLDKHLSIHTGLSRRALKPLFAQGRVTVDGATADDGAMVINKFQQVTLDDEPTQSNTPRYLMLHKPPAVVCATRDARHRTVIDLLDVPWKEQLHIVGRLDYNSTGMVLLTNDGQWSRQLSSPRSSLTKRYRVTTEKPISKDCVIAFKTGFHFSYENITTRPAVLTILGTHMADVELTEGRYHQIKRMFGRFDNKVTSIHRFAVGDYELGTLDIGAWRHVPGDISATLREIPKPGTLKAAP